MVLPEAGAAWRRLCYLDIPVYHQPRWSTGLSGRNMRQGPIESSREPYGALWSPMVLVRGALVAFPTLIHSALRAQYAARAD